MPTTEVKTQAHNLRHAIKNTQDGDNRFYDATMWRVLKAEQYDYEAKAWHVAHQLEYIPLGRDYAANWRG